jgi:hypothetical protein
VAEGVLRGSCLCGAMRYEITGPLHAPLHCHCATCRKAQGSAFRTRAGVRREDFRWLSGKHLLAQYQSSPGTLRGFCRVCGSPLVNAWTGAPDMWGLALGTLDDDPGIRPGMHVFVGAKAPWYEITDELPQHDEFPPTRSSG